MSFQEIRTHNFKPKRSRSVYFFTYLFTEEASLRKAVSPTNQLMKPSVSWFRFVIHRFVGTALSLIRSSFLHIISDSVSNALKMSHYH